ncbi:hypothetical protein AU197_03700 [Mycobacterium sp. IS-1590]|uniref:FHA domain-containing protein n=1 Tax=Mycobacterium sp. IS-1590 TaxID=1772286 RepID=UPI0007469A98|nr:FHA domain-containing protein [Mycobacterium sp. IS-1590]KUI44411.1 hypothetical protein AU197_03700 [Mycobacterium sp. IS-1590]
MDEGRPTLPGATTGELPSLVITVAGSDYTAHPGDGAVTIGRELPAQIRVSEPGISRTHVRIEPAGDQWNLVDCGSRNGTYVGGRRVDSVVLDREVSAYLGNPEGILVRVRPRPLTAVGGTETFGGPPPDEQARENADVTESAAHDPADDPGDQPDPDIARAGAAVAARREELGLSQRKLTDDHVISQSVLVKFERGRHWPRERTRTKIEEYLHWAPGTLARIRAGEPVPEEESTEAITPTVQVAIAIDAADIALRGIYARAALLPMGEDPRFAGEAAALLAELRRLETSLTNAARTATGRPELAITLGEVRQAYADLMRRAAAAPTATLGQRLYVARHQRQLTVQETANAAGVSASDVTNAEAEVAVPDPAAATLQRFVDMLERPEAR